MTVQDSTEKFLLSIKTLPYWVAKNNHFYLDVNVKTSLDHDSDRCYLTYDIKIQVSDLEFLREVWDEIETEEEYQELDKFIENNPIGSLKQLRDKRLYRSTHNSFKFYVRDRFDFTRRAADYLIASAEVMKNLKREQFVLGTNVLPTRESHCRPLAKLSPQEHCRSLWG